MNLEARATKLVTLTGPPSKPARTSGRYGRGCLRLGLCALLLGVGWAPALGQSSTTLQVSGIDEPVEILMDRWGIPHIYAETEDDLFFGQGFNAARHRLFQLELWRRQVTGTVSELLGPRTLDKDIGARLLRYRGDLPQELNHYHERGTEVFQAFVDGVNAYIAETERNPELLPIEFELLGTRPHPWTVDVVVSRLNGLYGNVTAEVRNAQLLQAMDEETLRLLSDFRPQNPDLSSDGVDLSLISDDVVRLYREARSPVTFTRADIASATDRALDGDPRPGPVETPSYDASGDWMELGYGSNNWVVSGARTLSGFPMLANDPHRGVSVPALRYVVHLVGGGWNAIGSGEPTVPGVSMGHNEMGAWGLTIHGRDMEDLYVYETNPRDPNQYRYRGEWEDMRIVRESIPVRGQEAEVVELKFTRHGPVLYEDTRNAKAYALRAAWQAAGAAPYLADLRYGRATNFEEFRDGVSYHLGPAHNVVWADVRGDIGWQVSGLAPIRSWSGLLPVSGDGRYEWDGVLPVKELPHVLNPPAGFFASANEHNVPEGYPYVFSHNYSEPLRSARIHELLGESWRYLTVADMHQIQEDQYSIPARVLLPLLRGLEPASEAGRRALALLREWDLELAPESAGAAVYVSWERRLRAHAEELFVPEAARDLLNVPTVRVLDWYTSPDGRFGDDPLAGRDRVLLQSLDEAVDDLTRRLGPDMGAWRYGDPRFKHIEIRHMLSDVVSEELRERLDVGPSPRGGTGYTVSPTGYGDNQTSGPSYRIVADASNWDNSVVTANVPGQSGDPDSPHYRDLFDLYVAGKHTPLFFTRAKIESVTEEVFRLVPGGS